MFLRREEMYKCSNCNYMKQNDGHNNVDIMPEAE